jgi:DNA-binding NarL/FixJ family response regulator
MDQTDHDTGSPRVVLIDDHELLSSALQIAMEVEGRARVVATAASLAEGMDAVRCHQPDVVLTDRRLPDGDVDQVVGDLLEASPRSLIVMMTGWPTERSSLAAFEAGAKGIVLKTEPVAKIVEAVLRVAAGDVIVPVDLVDRMFGSIRGDRRGLSARELDVLEALAAGETTGAAAAQLCMSQNTLRNHLSRAMLKLGAHDRLGAVTEAMRRGLISPRLHAADEALVAAR